MKNPMLKSKEWIDEYYSRVSGSTSAAAVGLDEWKPRSRLAAEMRDPSARADLSNNPNIRKGHFGEHAALWWLQGQLGLDVTPYDQAKFVYSDRFPHAHCLPDAFAEDGNPCEVKVVGYGVLKKIRAMGIPTGYLVQCQHNMALTGREAIHFGAFNFDYQDGYFETVARNDDMLSVLMPAEQEFHEAVKRGEEIADVTTLPDQPGLPTRMVIDDPAALALASQYLSSKAEVADGETMIDELKEQLQALLGNNCTEFEFAGVARGRWKEQGTGQMFDHKTALVDHPELKKYMKDKAKSRPFVVTPIK